MSRYRKSRETIAALKLKVGFSHHVEVGVTREHVHTTYSRWLHVWAWLLLQKLTIDAPGRVLLEEGEVTLVERKWKRNKKVRG